LAREAELRNAVAARYHRRYCPHTERKAQIEAYWRRRKQGKGKINEGDEGKAGGICSC
jgi:hypothetical protein